ncbi:MAG: class I SAM-dependent methyltransferase [Actinomycetota bacterium]
MGLWDRIWASGYDFLEHRFGKIEEPYRRRVVEELTGDVLEVGSGTGFNFGYYRKADRVVGLEPSDEMRKRSHDRAARAAVPIEVVAGSGEQLDYPDASFDAVVFTLVLCTIPHPERALAEAKRVLRPGGQIHFYEHVRSPNESTARWQDRLDVPWSAFNRGCHANRDTLGTIRSAGLTVEQVEEFDLKGAPGICRAHVLGSAVPA